MISGIEFVPCALCSSEKVRPLRDKTRLLRIPSPLMIVKCLSCGLVYMNPRPKDGEKYGQEYFEELDILTYENQRAGQYYSDKYERLEGLLPSRRTLLDCGCGTGHFLKVGKERGWKVCGIDTSEWALGYSKKRFAVDIFNASTENLPFKRGSFDVVVLHHILEHLRHPGAVLEDVRRILKEDGILLVEVPNEFRDLLFILSGQWGKKRYYPLSGPVLHHLYFFIPGTLMRFLKDYGFAVVSLSTMNKKLFVTSKFPLGTLIKKTLYSIGGIFGRGPYIEVIARKISV